MRNERMKPVQPDEQGKRIHYRYCANCCHYNPAYSGYCSWTGNYHLGSDCCKNHNKSRFY